jgi:multiple sugar transport system substrate-binding protein
LVVAYDIPDFPVDFKCASRAPAWHTSIEGSEKVDGRVRVCCNHGLRETAGFSCAMGVRMKLLKTVLVPALLLLAVGGLFGQKKTVTFMCIEADLPKDFVDAFNAANPDINLVRTEEDWTEWVADALAGSASDLIRMGTGTDTAYYAKRGLLYDMTKMIRASKVVKVDDIDRAGSSAYRFDGNDFGKGAWYGLSKEYSTIGCLTYNKEMFKAAGVASLSQTKPITYYDDLYNLARKLTRKDSSGRVTVWGYDVHNAWVQFLVSDMATAQGISFYGDAKKSVMNDELRLKELWKYWARFQVEDISSNIRNPNSGWQGSAFQSDRVAIAQLGYWFGAQLQSNKGYDTKYGWAPTPIVRTGARRVTNTLGATGIVMYARTRVPKEAFRVWEWYVGGGYGLERARSGWGIPPLLSLRKYLPEDNAYNRSRKAIAFDDAKYLVSWQASPYITWLPFTTAYSKRIDDLVKGAITADTFMDGFFAEVNLDLRAGREELGE